MNNNVKYIFLIIILLFLIYIIYKNTIEGFTNLEDYNIIAPVESVPIDFIQQVSNDECSKLSTTIVQDNMIQTHNGVATTECCANNNCFF